ITFQGKEVPYAVIPDYSQDCGTTDEATMMFASSHELTEAVTDADVGSGNVAWNSDQDQGQEIGDLCAQQPAAQLGSYIVQPEWSNYDDGCVVESTYRLPICTAALVPPNCRLCGPPDNGVACAAPTAQCDSNPSSGSYGKCVACFDNSGCTATAPICDTTTNTCRGCTSDADCKVPTPTCATSASDPKHGSCVACTTSATCAAPTPVCDTSSDTCVACDVDADCKSSSAPKCTNHTCGPCIGSNCGGPSVDGGGGDDGGNGATPTGFTTTTTSCGCAIESQGGGLGALAFAAGVGLTAVRRRRRSR
ncbi:MAG TPA: MYXO-CTERM sorting domain-containing protein, partial [Polyangiaceae bacterium]